jgi:hypothetical protein
VQIFHSRNDPQYRPQYLTVGQCSQFIVKNYGWRALWQGLSGTILRNVPANALFFPVAELVKRHYAEVDGCEVKHLHISRNLTAGACAGLSYWVTTYPLDVIKVFYILFLLTINLKLLIFFHLVSHAKCRIR